MAIIKGRTQYKTQWEKKFSSIKVSKTLYTILLYTLSIHVIWIGDLSLMITDGSWADGFTFLCIFFSTAGYNNLEVAEYLLEHGADVNAQDKGGLIPLHNAASYGVSAIAD